MSFEFMKLGHPASCTRLAQAWLYPVACSTACRGLALVTATPSLLPPPLLCRRSA